jgi:hypothetical protein
MSRLRLDFSLSTAEERKEFIDNYMKSPMFHKCPPTDEELEMMGNYLLWGRDADGKNAVQKKEVQITTRHGTWDARKDDSLDALIESPAFNEANIHRAVAGTAIPKTPKVKFDRARALNETRDDPLLHKTFLALFKEIDELDLILNFYDLNSGKRKTPPRQKLLNAFSAEEIEKLRERANKMSPFKYLKLRHHLVELRREQFTLRDSYKETILRKTPFHVEAKATPPAFDTDIPVLPLGLYTEKLPLAKMFCRRDQLIPSFFSEDELRAISKLYWEKRAQEENLPEVYFDFRELEHVYNLFLQLFEIEDACAVAKEDSNVDSTTDRLLRTLFFYTEMADLDRVHSEILHLKIEGERNYDIAHYINRKYGKSYTTNYISTIFRQKILVKICAAAALHEKIIGNVFFPENFKKCSMCGTMLLRDPDFFVRKARAKDGLSSRCKACDKKERERKKLEAGK